MSKKKSETKKPSEKKTTKAAAEPKANRVPSEAKKAASAKAKKAALHEAPASAEAKRVPSEAKKVASAKAKKATLHEASASEAADAGSGSTPASDAPAKPAVPHAPDPRLPTPGTLLQKRDRHGAVRCECTVEESGVRYDGTIYKSLSAAAMAAAKDLGLTNKTQNGFVFWGLSKPPRRSGDPLEAITRSWTRYHDQVTALLKDGVTDDNRVEVAATITEHLQAFEGLRAKVA
ncbi:MAG TPA: DUF2924 domain-containing protein [Polyangiaceae bacterium]|nr:DUF2924 domain-containing protein [Polyangiaceae bacterium]